MDNQEENKVMAIIGANGGIGSTLARSFINSSTRMSLRAAHTCSCELIHVSRREFRIFIKVEQLVCGRTPQYRGFKPNTSLLADSS